MPSAREVLNRIRYLLRRSRIDAQIADEVQFHLEVRIEELKREGLSDRDAAARAHREFGSPLLAREDAQGAWRFTPLEDFVADLTFAARLARKRPIVSAVIVIMLALGIGINATVFAWLDAIVMNPLPGVATPSTLVVVTQTDSEGAQLPLMSYPDFQELSHDDTLAGSIGTRSTAALFEHDGRRNWVSASVASAGLFEVLGLPPEYGRTFGREDDFGEGQHPIVVLSDAFWRREFDGDTSVLNRTVRINQQAFTVIGIAPARFLGVSGGSRIDVWAPLSMHAAVLNFGSYTSRTFRWIRPLARLRPGVTLTQAQAALAVLSAQMATAHPDTNAGVAFRVFPLWQSPYGGQAAFLPVLPIVLAMSGGLLLIVIANVACLTLSRGASRHAEMQVRIAIGAGRLRLVRQLITESLLLTLAGGAGGIVFAYWAVRAMPRLISLEASGLVYDLSVSYQALAFTMALTLVTAILVGVLPALTASGVDVAGSLRSGGRGATGSVRHRRALAALVISEIAVALALLVGGGLCVRGFQQAARIDVGFDLDRVAYAGLNLVPNGYSAARARIFDRALRERLRVVPGILDAAFVNTPPLGSMQTFTGAIDIEGRPSRANENPMIPFVIGSPGYLSVMHVPLLAGRDFDDADDDARSHVAIVNDTMVRRYWAGVNPIGRRFRMAIGVTPPETLLVIGVCGTSKYASLAEPATPMVYVTYLQRPLASLFMNVVVRTGTPELAATWIRQEVHALDPGVEPFDAMPMRRYVEPAFTPVRTAATLLVIVGAAALLLATIGLYAVMSYVVSDRSREIAVRLALGAAPIDAIRLVVGQGMTLVAAGIGAGQVVAYATTRGLTRFLYGVSTTDAGTLLTITWLLTCVALVACVIPARRIARTDSVAVMRSD
jgi:predicted permease